jgi:uncharacterized protein YdhG (YjbR/CyaY superfamily)
MAKTNYKSVGEYIATQPASVRSILKSVRAAIRKALPSAMEVISYQIPAYKLQGRVVIYFAGWKQHYSIYPATKAVVTALKDELAGYELSKGTIRFPFNERVPIRLIGRIARLRAKEVAEREKAKVAPSKR